MAEFAVIGLGRFGRAVARSLTRAEQSVLAIDRDRTRLDQVAGEVDTVVQCDTTDENAMHALGLERMACAVVAMGSRATEASVLTTAILRELEVPRLIARAFDDRHARLLLAIGAHEVLNPEEDLARQWATRLAHPSIAAEIRLGDAVIAEVEAPESLVGRPLADMSLRQDYGVSILAIRHAGETRVNPRPDDAPESGDILVLLGPPGGVHKLSALA